MKPILFIHGVQSIGDASGFSSEMQENISAQCDGMGITAPLMRELVWSDLLNLSGALGALDVIADIVRYESPERIKVVKECLRRFRSSCKILDKFGAPDGLLVVAHSLGSVLMLDMMQAAKTQLGSDLLTIGSPLGLDVPALPGNAFKDRRGINTRGIRWIDIWARGDAVHTGAVFGVPIASGCAGLRDAGYFCQSVELDLGNSPLSAHSEYWSNKQVSQTAIALASTE